MKISDEKSFTDRGQKKKTVSPEEFSYSLYACMPPLLKEKLP